MRLLVVTGRSRKMYRPSVDEFIRRVSSWYWNVTQIDLEDFLANPPDPQSYDNVAIAGGDGTVNACLPALAGRSILILPSGTGNDLARSLGILGISDSVALISSGRTANIDIGTVEYDGRTELFANGIGIGLDGIVSKGHRRGIPYSISALSLSVNLPRYTAQIAIENEAPSELTFLSLVLANGNFFGGGYKLAPDAAIDDGLLDVVMTSPVTPIKYISSLIRAQKGQHTGDPAVTSNKIVSISISSERKLPWHLDGEYRECHSMKIEILPEARSFYAAI